MEDIKVGDYVRTDNGIIGKYIIQQNINYIDTGKQFIGIDIEKDIVKNSPNIIDLIEVGDYINESKLLSIDYAEDKNGDCDKLHLYYSFEDTEKDINEYYEELIIKSIVTKEQFNTVKYEV